MPTSNDAALAAGTTAAISAGNAIATANLNKRNRKFSREMYEIQKADNLAFWNMQNEYNSPAAQMERFKAAGLNPNLIYGQTNTAGPVSIADMKQPDQTAPRWGDAGQGALAYLDAMYNFELKAAQTDNVKAQNDLIKTETALKAASINNVDVRTRRDQFNLDFESELRQTSVDARMEALRQTQTNIDLAVRNDVRETLKTASSLKEANERIQNLIVQRGYMKAQKAHTEADRDRILEDTKRIKQQTSLMFQDGVIKDLDVALSQANVRPGDPVWYRSLGLIVDQIFKAFE